MRLLRAFAATTLAVGAAVLAVPAPAGAATCSGGNGVSVVVDYRELGGSTVTACAPEGGGKSAAAIFAEAGVQITYAQRQPGFVCRVNGVPTSDPCQNTSPTDAFWGLWWSDGARPWTYASSGVGSLTVPAGGSVGWSWQQNRAAGQAVPPGVPAPTAPAPSQSASPSPSPSPSPSSSSSPSSSPSPTAAPGSASSSTPTRSPQPTASPTKRPDGPKSSAPTDSAASSRADASASAPGTSSATASDAPKAKTKSRQRAEKAPDGRVEPSASASSASLEVATEPPAVPEAAADEPARIPAALTWGIVASLGVAVLASALVSRRRRRT